MDVIWIAFLGAFIGVAARISLPFMRKLWTGEIEGFELKYLVQAVVALYLSLIVTMSLGPALILTDGTNFVIFNVNFLMGFGSTSIIDELFKWGNSEKAKLTTELKPT